MRLILTRHARTKENEAGILQGWMPGHLSEEGIKQANKLAESLKDEKIDVIYSSDLKRAKDTTKIVAKYHPHTPIIYDKRIREADLGVFTGKHKNEVDWKNRPKEMESRQSMRARSSELLEEVYKKYPNGSVLFLGHNGTNNALMTYILDKDIEYMDEMKDQDGTGLNIFEINKNKNKTILFNSTEHLK